MSFIVPMEKPKRCGLCPCFHAEHPMHCQAVKAHKDKRIIAPYGAPIPDWCPLVELPPHGRLIDADKLMMSLADWWYSSFGEEETDEAKAIRKVLDEVEQSIGAMTVVETEEEGTEWTR